MRPLPLHQNARQLLSSTHPPFSSTGTVLSGDKRTSNVLQFLFACCAWLRRIGFHFFHVNFCFWVCIFVILCHRSIFKEILWSGVFFCSSCWEFRISKHQTTSVDSVVTSNLTVEKRYCIQMCVLYPGCSFGSLDKHFKRGVCNLGKQMY